MVGVAVNVNEFPEQFGFVPDVNAIETVGVTVVLTVIDILFEFAVVGLAHVAVDVIVHVTACPLVIADEVNVALFVPAFIPATCHW